MGENYQHRGRFLLTPRRSSVLASRLLLCLAISIWLACALDSNHPPGSNQDAPLEPVLAEASVDRAVATTGDVITFRVKVDYDESYEVQMVEPGSEIAGFRIVDLGREENLKRSGRIIEERWYRLRADLVGSYILPPVRVGYQMRSDGGGSGFEDKLAGDALAVDSIETSAIFIEVESVLPSGGEATDIRGLKPIRKFRSNERLWWLVGGLIGLGLILVIAYLMWRRRERVVVPPPPPHELAFEALRVLREIDLENPEQIRRFYFGISETIRAYVEGRFRLNATDLTTEEILFNLRKLEDLAANNRERLEFFLKDTDQVKFADHEPTDSEIEETYERALAFVESSIPTPTEEASP